MKTNSNYQLVVDEQDIVSNWLTGNNSPSSIVVADTDFINIYNDWCTEYEVDDTISAKVQSDADKYIEECTSVDNWNMPDHYKTLSMKDVLQDKLRSFGHNDPTSAYYTRVNLEYTLYEDRGMVPVLKFLTYLVDICEEKNVVLGVGRGSSVASYILFLLGVHRIDSVKYELDIKEFLK